MKTGINILNLTMPEAIIDLKMFIALVTGPVLPSTVLMVPQSMQINLIVEKSVALHLPKDPVLGHTTEILN